MMNKKAFATVVSTMFISMLGMGFVVPLLPIYANTMGASALVIGLINAGFSITLMIFLPIMGKFSDRTGRKVFLCTGLSCFTIAALGFLWARNPFQLIMVRCFQGFSASMHLPIAQAYLGDITPKGGEGKWMGYFNAVLFSGMGLGPFFGGVLTDLFGIDATFLVMAALSLIGLIATLIFLPEVRDKATVQKQSTSFAYLMKSDILKGAFAFRMGTGFATACFMTFLPLFASINIGLSTTLIGLLLASRTPVALIQSLTGRLADKYNRRIMVVCGGAFALIAMVVLPMTGSFWQLLALYVCTAVGIAFALPAATAFVVEEGRIFGMGASMALFMMAMQIGHGVGPILLGGVVDVLGIKSAFFAGAGLLLVGIRVFIWYTREYSPDKRRSSAGGRTVMPPP
jgi:MFS transporter, DHA1 family, multidrug resistance protein